MKRRPRWGRMSTGRARNASALPRHRAAGPTLHKRNACLRPRQGSERGAYRSSGQAPTLDELIAETRQTYSGPLEVGADLASFKIGDTVSVHRFKP
jgi:hypothetical protein